MDKTKLHTAGKSDPERPEPERSRIDMVRKEIAKAENLRKHNELEKALIILSRCLALAPNFDEVYLAKAEVFRQGGQLDQALTNLDLAIKLNSKNAAAYIQRGEIYRLLKRFEEALKDLDRAIQLEPANSLALGRRGTLYRSTHEYARSLADYNQAIALDPSSTWLFGNRAETYRNLQDYRKALNDYNEVLRLDPKLTWVYERRSYTQLWLGYLRSAQADFEHAWQSNPSNIMNGWMALWTEMCHNSFNFNSGFKEKLNSLAEHNPRHFAAYLCRSSLLWLLGSYKKSYSEAQLACELTQDKPEAMFWKGMAAAGLGRTEEAFDLVQLAEDSGLHPVLLGPLRWQKEINPKFYQKYSANFIDKSPAEPTTHQPLPRLTVPPIATQPETTGQKQSPVRSEEARPPQPELITWSRPVEHSIAPARESKPDTTSTGIPVVPPYIVHLKRQKFDPAWPPDDDSDDKTLEIPRPEIDKIRTFPEKTRHETTLPGIPPVKPTPPSYQDTLSLRVLPLRDRKENLGPAQAIKTENGKVEQLGASEVRGVLPVRLEPVNKGLAEPKPLEPVSPQPVEGVMKLPLPQPGYTEVIEPTLAQPLPLVQSPNRLPAKPLNFAVEQVSSAARPSFKIGEPIAIPSQEIIYADIPPGITEPEMPGKSRTDWVLPLMISLFVILLITAAVLAFIVLVSRNVPQGTPTIASTVNVQSSPAGTTFLAATLPSTAPAASLPATVPATTAMQNPSTTAAFTTNQNKAIFSSATTTLALNTVVAVTVAPSTAAGVSPSAAAFSQLSTQVLEGQASSVTAASWTRDGRYFATGADDKTIKVWETVTNKPVTTLTPKTEGGKPLALSWSSDGKYLISGWSDKNVRVFQVFADNNPGSGPTGQMLKEISGGALPEAVAISPDHRIITIPGQNVLNIIDIAGSTTEPGLTLGPASRILAVNFSQDYKYLAAGLEDGRVLIWDRTTFKLVLVILPDQNKLPNPVKTVNWTPDGTMLVVGAQKSLAVYRITFSSGAKVLDIPISRELKSPVTALSVSANGKLFAVGYSQGGVELWSIEQNKLLGQLATNSEQLLSLGFSGDNRQVFALTGGNQPRRITISIQLP